MSVAAMPVGLDPPTRAEWLRQVCRTLDLVTASREDVIVGAIPGVAMGGPYAAHEFVFLAFREDFDEDAWRDRMAS